MQLKPIVVIAVLLLVVTSLSVGGCTVGTTDYSDYYNKFFRDSLIQKEFYKRTNSRQL